MLEQIIFISKKQCHTKVIRATIVVSILIGSYNYWIEIILIYTALKEFFLSFLLCQCINYLLFPISFSLFVVAHLWTKERQQCYQVPSINSGAESSDKDIHKLTQTPSVD